MEGTSLWYDLLTNNPHLTNFHFRKNIGALVNMLTRHLILLCQHALNNNTYEFQRISQAPFRVGKSSTTSFSWGIVWFLNQLIIWASMCSMRWSYSRVNTTSLQYIWVNPWHAEHVGVGDTIVIGWLSGFFFFFNNLMFWIL